MPSPHGILTLSLDFELYWGTRDHASLGAYGKNILGAREAIPRMLSLFEELQIHATWAFVGLLAFDGVDDAKNNAPKRRPQYALANLDPYSELEQVEKDPERAKYFFAPDLLQTIASTPNQELASHTFSHYYCLEAGQSPEDFEADLEAMQALGERRFRRALTSLVFPRNQASGSYLERCTHFGIRAYRGNPRSWIYAPRANSQESPVRRAARLLDAYVNLTGHHGYRLEDLAEGALINVPASRFLRPYSSKLRALDRLRLKRILMDLSYCARRGLLYHLWWHPENFGTNLEQNMGFLRAILEHYKELEAKYSMQSMTMAEVAHLVAGMSRGGAATGDSALLATHTVSESR